MTEISKFDRGAIQIAVQRVIFDRKHNPSSYAPEDPALHVHNVLGSMKTFSAVASWSDLTDEERERFLNG